MILTSQIKTSTPFTLESEISCADVDAYLGDFEDYSAVSPVRFKAVLKRSRKGIEMEAEIHAELKAPCQCCLDEVRFPFDLTCSLLLIEAAQAPKTDETCLSEEDLDVVIYNEPKINIEDIILETVFLELEPCVRCSDNCKGLCPNCGQNLNHKKCVCTEF